MTFHYGETIICERSVYDNGTKVSPDTSFTITITDPYDNVVVNAQNMTPDGVGEYHFDYDSTLCNGKGRYCVQYKAIHGTRITIVRDSFNLI